MGLFAAAGGEAGRVVARCRVDVARQPPIYPRLQVRWPQEALERVFSELYLQEIFAGFRFPFIEDLVNSFPFTAYHEWREERDLPSGIALPPAAVAKAVMRTARSGSGIQQGAFSHRAALPPLVSFGLSAGQHFLEAREAAAAPTPLEVPSARDPDLGFAARARGERTWLT